MPDYSKSKIYEIICNINGWRYIGSTTLTLSQRLGKHRYISNTCKSKQIIEQGDYYINLLENYPCNNKDELRMKERKWYDKLKNINQMKPYISIDESKEEEKEYYINNKEKFKEKHKDYYETNKEKFKEKHKDYYETNKENLKEKTKEYRINNANKLKEKRKEKITCECGAIIRRVGKSIHERSIKHMNFLQNNSTVEPSTELVITTTNP